MWGTSTAPLFSIKMKEKQQYKAYIDKLNASGKYDKPIATTLEPLGVFYVAEGYHQDYYPCPQPAYVARFRTKVEKFTKAHPGLLKRDIR